MSKRSRAIYEEEYLQPLQQESDNAFADQCDMELEVEGVLLPVHRIILMQNSRWVTPTAASLNQLDMSAPCCSGIVCW